MKYDMQMLPEHMRAGVVNYIERGVCGDFLKAVFSNQLVEAYARADDINSAAMFQWASWLYNFCPTDIWGSPEKVRAHMEAKAAERAAQ